jgi:hypothetical protein
MAKSVADARAEMKRLRRLKLFLLQPFIRLRLKNQFQKCLFDFEKQSLAGCPFEDWQTVYITAYGETIASIRGVHVAKPILYVQHFSLNAIHFSGRKFGQSMAFGFRHLASARGIETIIFNEASSKIHYAQFFAGMGAVQGVTTKSTFMGAPTNDWILDMSADDATSRKKQIVQSLKVENTPLPPEEVIEVMEYLMRALAEASRGKGPVWDESVASLEAQLAVLENSSTDEARRRTRFLKSAIAAAKLYRIR